MPDAHNRTTESEFAEAVLEILVDAPKGELSYSQLIAEIPKYLNLTEEDKIPSDTREHEQVWEQRVRNITSHQRSSNNYIHIGYLELIDSGLKITDLGRARLENKI